MSEPNGPWTGRPPTYAPRGCVASPHYLASAAGLELLRRGGSAVDAAIAVNAVLCTMYPHMAGLGGDAFWLVHEPGAGAPAALNASGPAAARATIDYYRARGHTEKIPQRGGLSALTVPGAVDGWRLAHERYGRLAWEDLFGDAIHYAREGAPIGRSLWDWIARDVPELSRYPQMAGVFLPEGRRPYREGRRLVVPGLAGSFERLARQGPRAGFYEGETAETICRALEPHGSPLRVDDFAAFRAEWVQPVSSSYRGHTVHELPPNTQGFAALMILNLLEGYDVSAWGDGSIEYYYHCAEAVKLAFADRDAWTTDPRFVEIPLERLLSREYAAARREKIDGEGALDFTRVQPGLPFRADAFERRDAGGDTCYFCVADRDGMVVSSIESIYFDFGSMMMGGDSGIIVQNRGSFFQLDPGKADRLEPGKRPFHTLMPAMMYDADGEVELAFGTMGGEGQPQTQVAIVTRLVDFGYDVQQAIEAPRWLMGHTWGKTNKKLNLEGRIPQPIIEELQRRGEPINNLKDWDDNMGHAQALRVDRQSGFYEGGADPRGDGAALGY